jgi:small subunit ribosomal protein S20
MPQHKSSEKRVRTSEKKKEINKAYKTKLKNVIKNVRDQKDKESAEKSFQKAASVIDKIASKGVIHKNKAANQKSKLAKVVNKLAAAEKKA